MRTRIGRRPELVLLRADAELLLLPIRYYRLEREGTLGKGKKAGVDSQVKKPAFDPAAAIEVEAG